MLERPCTPRSRLGIALAAAIALLGAVSTARAGAGAPAVQVTWQLNDGPVHAIFPSGVAEGDDFVYLGTIVDPETGLTLYYDLEANFNTIGGTVELHNELHVGVELLIEVALATPGPMVDPAHLAAYSIVGFTAGPGGGELTSHRPAVWQALVDGEPVGIAANLFHDPWALAISGPGSASVWDDFGLGTPVTGPPIQQRLGYRVQLDVSNGDLAAVGCTLQVGNGPMPTCLGDLDGDDEVGVTDLVALLAAWGSDGEADLDGNGDVGITDLLLLLDLWGACP